MIMSDHCKRQLNIAKNHTYYFPPYIQKFHHFPYHSSPTLLLHLSTLPTFLQFQQNPSLHHHSLPLLHQMFYINYRYWPPPSDLSAWLGTNDESSILIFFSNQTAPLKNTLSLFTFCRLKTVGFLFLISVPE